MEEYNPLKLENQLCFPLYVCAKEVTKRYIPFLKKLDLTYTQYITMMVMWDKKKLNVSDLGKILFLDSGTLTPLLKKLEQKGYIERVRSKTDERNLDVSITQKGEELRAQALEVPQQMRKCISLSSDDSIALYQLLYKMLGQIE